MLMLANTILNLIKIIFLLIAIAYFTIAERKVMGAVQRRHGPDVVGFIGLLQPLADGLKLLVKELIIPTKTQTLGFLLAPNVILTLSLVSWSVIPFGFFSTNFLSTTFAEHIALCHIFELVSGTATVANINCGLLFLLAISSLNVYGIIVAGWASNSKYAFLGSLRSAAQMISYEVSIGLVILPIILCAGSLNLTQIVLVQQKINYFVVLLAPLMIIFFVSMLAETNRAPFDLPEAEAELVAGYNVEYSSIIFAMFFLGEYSNMILISATMTILFFGGWTAITGLTAAFSLSLKIAVFCFLFILVRAAFPRYRYDQLMSIGWKIFLPIATGYLVILVGFLTISDSLICLPVSMGFFAFLRKIPHIDRLCNLPVEERERALWRLCIWVFLGFFTSSILFCLFILCCVDAHWLLNQWNYSQVLKQIALIDIQINILKDLIAQYDTVLETWQAPFKLLREAVVADCKANWQTLQKLWDYIRGKKCD
jgi:NADH-quinone oxidoreductase subunit H